MYSTNSTNYPPEPAAHVAISTAILTIPYWPRLFYNSLNASVFFMDISNNKKDGIFAFVRYNEYVKFIPIRDLPYINENYYSRE